MLNIPKFQETFDTVKRLVDDNAHTEALIAIAKAVGAEIAEKKLRYILKLHELERHMPQSLIAYRFEVAEQMEKFALQIYNQQQVLELFSI